MAMVNPALFSHQVKDSRWLTLEVCREFTRNKCTRTETECKFAHPPPHVEVQNGRVTCCFDSIKGKCQRKDPPCKYLHPPQHLREQLLQNGRNNLIMRNLQMQALTQGMVPPPAVMPVQTMMYETGGSLKPSPATPVVSMQQTTMATSPAVAAATMPGQYPLVGHPYLTTTMGNQPALNPYLTPSGASLAMPGTIPTLDGTNGVGPSGQVQMVNPAATNVAQQKMNRPVDRLESMPGMVPMMKRPALADTKGGIAMYQPSSTGAMYQQALAAMQLQQQPFIPVTIAGHPPSMPRF